MQSYAYKGLNAQGDTVRGTISARSEQQAYELLNEGAIQPLQLRAARVSLRAWLARYRQGLGAVHLANFCQQMAILLRAGISYDAVLGMLQKEAANARMGELLGRLRVHVAEGVYLADAMARESGAFPSVMVSMVRSGEASGRLEHIMQRMGKYYEELHRLQNRLTSALIYPAFMMLFGFGMVAFLLSFVVPKISVLFDQFGGTLPLPTRMLIGLSNALSSWWWLFLLAALLLVRTWLNFLRSNKGRDWWHRRQLQIPIWGALLKKRLLQRFAETLAILLQNGVEMKEALSVSSQVLENQVYVQAVEQVMFNVQNRGATLAAAMRDTGVFPEDMCQMAAIGEETAALDAMLENVARRLEYELRSRLDALSALLEPAMILLMGSIVGFIVVSVLLPLFQLNQLLG